MASIASRVGAVIATLQPAAAARAKVATVATTTAPVASSAMNYTTMNYTTMNYTTITYAAFAILAIAIIDGFRRLAGSREPTPRPRQPGDSLAHWLLGPVMMGRVQLGLPGRRVRCVRSAAEADEWDADVPPPLAAVGLSHLWLPRAISRWVFPDTLFAPTPVEIDAPAADVWAVLMDFGRYGEWNGFHLRKEVVEKPNGLVGLRMTVDLGPVLGRVVETSTIYYVDEARHIFVYGLRGDEAASSIRVVWLEETSPTTTTFHSYDKVGGYPALLCRGHIGHYVLSGFNEQHLALRDRVHALKRAKAVAAAAATSPPRTRRKSAVAALGTCLVTGGTGFLGSHVVRMLASLEGVKHVHALDLKPPRGDQARAVGEGASTFHSCSITDADGLADVVRRVRPDTIFHVASLIDLRPGRASERANDEVNVEGTARLLELAKELGVARFVYTSTIETAYHWNSCEHAEEATTPYPAHPSNAYQRTKIAAERLVLAAHNSSPGLATVAVRPGHIFGHGEEDDLVNYLADVDVCFGSQKLLASASRGALMSMVHVENCALAHVLAASLAEAPQVGGLPFFVEDFDDNVTSLYRALAGRPPPRACLPYWLLCVLVHASIALHLALLLLSRGRYALLKPKTGLHDGALAAALPCTIRSTRARALLGYESWVSRDAAVTSARTSWPAAPLLDATTVAAAVARASGALQALQRRISHEA